MKKIISTFLTALLLLSMALSTTAGALEEAKEKIDRIRNGWTEPPTATPEPTETPIPDDYISPVENTYNWMNACGFKCNIYSFTPAYLEPLSNLFRTLRANGIYMQPEKIYITSDTRDYLDIEFGPSCCFMVNLEEGNTRIAIELPYSYLPADDVCRFAISAFTGVDPEEAADIYKSLQYNVLNETAITEVGPCTVNLEEPRRDNGSLFGFFCLDFQMELSDWNAIPPLSEE